MSTEAIVKRNYLEQQMFQLAPLPLDSKHFPYGFSIQMRGAGSATNWLHITAEQLKKIEDVLLEAV